MEEKTKEVIPPPVPMKNLLDEAEKMDKGPLQMQHTPLRALANQQGSKVKVGGYMGDYVMHSRICEANAKIRVEPNV